MAAYTQFGCGYPAANQFLPGSSLATTLTTLSTSMQSPLAATTTAASLSPASLGRESGGSSGSAAGTHSGGTLTPDPASQTSGLSGASSVATAPDETLAYTCGTAVSLASGASPPCCDGGRLIMTDPVSGQTVCSCQYDPTRLALSSYTRIQSAAGVGVYGTPYPSNEQNPYPSIGVDSTSFYSTLSNPYALKDTSNSSEVTAWTSAGLQPTAAYYTYDPTFTAYGYGANYDLAARRKNATRECTTTLKAWLNEHQKNPYPTKGEKIMLAIITKMTLTQVSTWFANARRRLKKENKMTWEPKNRNEDDDDEALPATAEEKERLRERVQLSERTNEKRHGVAGASHATGVAAGANEAAVGTGAVGSHNTGTGPSTGALNEVSVDVDVGVDVGGIRAQPKDFYALQHEQQQNQQQQQAQYSLNFYYNSRSQQQQQLQQLQQQQQSVLSALTQHVADSTLVQQQHQQQQQQPMQQHLPMRHADRH